MVVVRFCSPVLLFDCKIKTASATHMRVIAVLPKRQAFEFVFTNKRDAKM